MWSSVAGLGLSLKKMLRAAEQDRPVVASRRRIWQEARPFIVADKLVIIDETGTSTNDPILGPGPRLFAKTPFGHWKITANCRRAAARRLLAPHRASCSTTSLGRMRQLLHGRQL
jgi:hypothetical protein